MKTDLAVVRAPLCGLAMGLAVLASSATAATCGERHWSVALQPDSAKPTSSGSEALDQAARIALECEDSLYVAIEGHVPGDGQLSALLAAREIEAMLLDNLQARGLPRTKLVGDATVDSPGMTTAGRTRGAEIYLRARGGW